ncbi:pyridoxal phosphate-dependent aminotransferase [Actinoplanes siamensis]|uniref:Aminotransferase n=1 Tax=Actinoplanes siamensis TaxID=1223317 RepID=A0A919NBU1_9ACTN|nr:histidinol-phosphate transaminase [Actinoplanes siamensis]GIF08248.1 histidinol-phosphate aminotransferase [Actinoplanes siamensis]
MAADRFLKRALAVDRVHRWPAPTGRCKKIRLDLNENGAPLDEQLGELLGSSNNFLVGGYPEYDDLLDRLTEYTGRPQPEITLTNGADQAIDLVLRLLFGPGDTVVVPSPVFSYYYHVLDLASVDTVTPLFRRDGQEFAFPLDETLRPLAGADGLVLCHPNNPLGAAVPAATLTTLIERTAELRIPCIVDEAYFEYCGSTVAHLLSEHPQLIVIRSFSKFFGLAGLRLGYVLAAPSISADLLKMRGPWDVNHVAVQAAEVCLRRRDAFFESARRLGRNKAALLEFLRRHAVDVADTSTNFLLLPRRGDADLRAHFDGFDILASDLTGYPHSGGLLDGMTRIAVADTEDMPALASALAGYYGITGGGSFR